MTVAEELMRGDDLFPTVERDGIFYGLRHHGKIPRRKGAKLIVSVPSCWNADLIGGVRITRELPTGWNEARLTFDIGQALKKLRREKELDDIRGLVHDGFASRTPTPEFVAARERYASDHGLRPNISLASYGQCERWLAFLSSQG